MRIIKAKIWYTEQQLVDTNETELTFHAEIRILHDGLYVTVNITEHYSESLEQFKYYINSKLIYSLEFGETYDVRDNLNVFIDALNNSDITTIQRLSNNKFCDKFSSLTNKFFN